MRTAQGSSYRFVMLSCYPLWSKRINDRCLAVINGSVV